MHLVFVEAAGAILAIEQQQKQQSEQRLMLEVAPVRFLSSRRQVSEQVPKLCFREMRRTMRMVEAAPMATCETEH